VPHQVPIEKVSRATLRYLFQEYIKGPGVPYSINTVTDQFKADPVAVASFMMDRHWIREQWVHQNDLVTCRITVLGIEEVDPVFVHNKIKYLITSLIKAGGRKSLMEIFEHKIEEYAVAFDMVCQLEKLELVTIIHDEGRLDVALTPEGWNYPERRGKSLFSVMAVA
jgi:hypothetical protein